MDTLMNMFFFKIEKEYGIQKSLLASAWTEFNAATTVEILHLLPEEKQVSNLHITRCQHPIAKGDRAGQKCNRPAAEGTTECKRHTKSKSAASDFEANPHTCEHVMDVNTGKTCAHRVTVCTNHLKIYDAEHPHTDECVSVCASHLKFYDANYQRLPICTAVAKKSKKKCNRLAEEGTGTCAMHSSSTKTTSESDEPVNTAATKAKTVATKPATKSSKATTTSRATSTKKATPEKTTKAKASTSKKQVAKPVEEEEEIYNDIDENDSSDDDGLESTYDDNTYDD
jgi:hypothetical protein